jgi:hypothetical protein
MSSELLGTLFIISNIITLYLCIKVLQQDIKIERVKESKYDRYN